jgi:hypothetical protein
MAAGCLSQCACSSGNNNDWFRFGKDSPDKESAQEPVQLPDQQTTDDSLTQSQQETSETDPKVATPLAESQTCKNPINDSDPESTTSVETNPEANIADVEEIVQLYRRLHVETDQANRSLLIIELLNDPREKVKLLGFELASRDLSAGTTLSPDAANASINLLHDPLPSIRVGAARLINRLALPDAMTILTTALNSENDPAVAEALLRGIERWPNADARESVLKWYKSSTPAKPAAANAAWQIADLGLWDNDLHAPQIQSVYRTTPDSQLTQSDLRLIAITGTSADIDRLIKLAKDQQYAKQNEAANALAYTPLGVDPLINLATTDPKLSAAAARAVERHRLNPNGIRQIAALEWPTNQARTDALAQLCGKLDHEDLTTTIRLTQTDNTIDDTLAIRLLNRLIAGAQTVSPRSASGVALLAQLELKNLRPDRALEAISLLPESGLDPDTTLKAANTSTIAHILLGEYEQADLLTQSPQHWFDALSLQSDANAQLRIATAIESRAFELTETQQTTLETILTRATPPSSETP